MQTFEENKDISKAIEKMLAYCRTKKRGDVIPWPTVFEVTGIEYRGEHWQAFKTRFEKRLRRETGIALLLGAHGGFHLCTIEEQQFENPRRRRMRSMRNSRRMVSELRALPDVELTLHQRQMKNQNIEWGLREAKAVRRSLKQLKAASAPRESLPRDTSRPIVTAASKTVQQAAASA